MMNDKLGLLHTLSIYFVFLFVYFFFRKFVLKDFKIN